VADAGDHSAALTNRKPHGGRTRVRRKPLPKPYERLGGIRQLNRTELWQRIADAPSRRDMQRPYPREDLRENFGRFYDWMWRAARHNRSARVDTTWMQCAIGNGYDPDGLAPGKVVTSMKNYAELAAEIGVAVMGGVQDASGAWRRCDFRLLDPDVDCSDPRRSSSVAKATRPSRIAVRRRESRRERHANRHQPHRRRGGRGAAKPRYRLFFQPSNLGSPLKTTPTTSGSSLNNSAGPRAGLDRRTPAPPNRERPGPAAPPSAADVEAALQAIRKAALSGEREPLLAAANAAQHVVSIDVIGELAFRHLFGAEPRLSKKRRLQLRRTAGQLERTAFFGKGAAPGLAAEQLVGYMAAHRDRLRLPPQPGGPPPARPASLGYFVVKLRRQARKWRDTERRRRGAQPKGKRCSPTPSG
jgi:hypothetical protein